MRTAIFLVVLVFGLVGTTIAAVTDDVYVSAAKETLARDLDSDLPALPLEEWLRGLVGETARVAWEVTDCGEQTGTSADPERDLPTCAEHEAE